MSEAPRSEGTARLLGPSLLLHAAAIPLSIAVAQSALALAVLAWIGTRRTWAASPLIGPALGYAGFTLASALASADRWTSLIDTKELLLFWILLLVPTALSLDKRLGMRLIAAFLGGSGLSAGWGIVSFLASPGGLAHRSRGPLGHYLTYAGVLMLASTVAMAILLAPSRPGQRWRGSACALLLLGLLIALACSYARSAWLGIIAGWLLAAFLLRPRTVPLVVAAGVIALLVAPADMRSRAASILSLEQNQDRVEMLESGLEMIRERPLLGAGPNRIPDELRRLPGARVHPHLHSNLIQIAAERGLGALATWCWLMAATAHACFLRATGAPRAWGLGVIAALVVAGLFEYNFGDSEVKMAFLLLISVAIHLAPGTAPTFGPESATTERPRS